jgi:bacterioferritin
VEGQFANDKASEEEAVKAYNKNIQLALEAGDNGTRELLELILTDEEEHLDWIEAQQDQIKQMGIENYLGEQIS